MQKQGEWWGRVPPPPPFLRARVCWPLLCLWRKFMIYEGCLESNPECCRSKRARYQPLPPPQSYIPAVSRSPHNKTLALVSKLVQNLRTHLYLYEVGPAVEVLWILPDELPVGVQDLALVVIVTHPQLRQHRALRLGPWQQMQAFNERHYRIPQYLPGTYGTGYLFGSKKHRIPDPDPQQKN
jgi:hypothetical protein